jgi:hypothetical protein
LTPGSPNAAKSIIKIAWPGVGDADKISIEIHHLAAHGSAAERASQEANHQRKPIALVSTDRQQKTLTGTIRIEQRMSLTIDHPPLGHHFASLGLGFDLSISCDGRRHVETPLGGSVPAGIAAAIGLVDSNISAPQGGE